MAWLKIDDGFAEHPKVDALSDKAFRLHLTALCLSARKLTDGKLNPRDVKICRLLASNATDKHVAELVKGGLWRNGNGVYEIHDYLRYNPPAEKVRGERRAAAERQARHRAKRPTGELDVASVDYEAVLKRDGYTCYLCAKEVAPDQVHFDHVVPLSKGGEHTESNVRVTHKRCNLRKNKYVTGDVTRDVTSYTTGDTI